MNRIQDIDLKGKKKKKIKPDFDVGKTFTNDRGSFTTVRNKGQREVSFDWSSYVGISMGAMHYYGKLRFYGNAFHIDSLVDGDKKGWMEVGKIGNFCGAFQKPEELDGLQIELTRPLTQEEIDKYPSRWKGRYGIHTAGQPTSCFDTLDDVIKRCKEVYEQIFVKGVHSGIEWHIDLGYAEEDAIRERESAAATTTTTSAVSIGVAFARQRTLGAKLYGGIDDDETDAGDDE